MRELVTIQVGGFANFIGSHFWNFQDELLGLAVDPNADPIFKNQHLDMDMLYRTGETQQGIATYTPRLVSVNFRGSFGSMSSHGTLYDHSPPVPSHVVTWPGSMSTHLSEPYKKNLFLQSLDEEEQENLAPMDGINSGKADKSEVQDKDIVESLESGVQFWTDFSKVHYHPQSLYELNGLWMDAQDFDNYGSGVDVFSEGPQGEEINERLRFFVEECDHIQGIQFIVDDSGGFSCVAADFLENIADEYTSTPILLYTVRGPESYIHHKSRRQTMIRDLHDAVSFSRLSSLCKLFVPIGLPLLGRSKASSYLCLKDEKPYHCSAVYASALHSISLPFRMATHGPATDSCYVSGAVDVYGLIQILTGQARQNIVATLDAAMPAPSFTGKQVAQSWLGSLHPFTPEIAEDVEDLQEVESLTIHGAFGSGGDRASVSEVEDTVHAAYASETTKPLFSHLSVAQCPLPIPLPFPSVFSNLVGQHGELLGSPVMGGHHPRGSIDVHSIPMAARLRSTCAILPFLENRLGNLRRFGIARGASGSQLLSSWGFANDELEDTAERLSKMIMTLDPHSQSSSDSD